MGVCFSLDERYVDYFVQQKKRYLKDKIEFYGIYAEENAVRTFSGQNSLDL